MLPHIIALTAHINAQVRAQVKATGFEDLISVPLTVDKVLKKIIPALEEREARINEKNELAMLYKDMKRKGSFKKFPSYFS